MQVHLERLVEAGTAFVIVEAAERRELDTVVESGAYSDHNSLVDCRHSFVGTYLTS